MDYHLKGALYELGDLVSYGNALYVIKARRLTPVGIVYQLLPEDAELHAHHNVPQAALDPVPAAL